MNVFLGWSGELSHKVALLFRDWLPRVIQAVEPFVSDRDIPKGTEGKEELKKQLKNASFGILCITKDNVDAQWICYEAGAMADIPVSPFLLDVDSSGVPAPLFGLQYTVNDETDVNQLVRDINSANSTNSLGKMQLNEAFECHWPQLRDGLSVLLKQSLLSSSQRDQMPQQESDVESRPTPRRGVRPSKEIYRRCRIEALASAERLETLLGGQDKSVAASAHYVASMALKFSGPSWTPGDCQKVVCHLGETLKRFPEWPEAHFNLAIALSKLERTANSLFHYQRAIECFRADGCHPKAYPRDAELIGKIWLFQALGRMCLRDAQDIIQARLELGEGRRILRHHSDNQRCQFWLDYADDLEKRLGPLERLHGLSGEASMHGASDQGFEGQGPCELSVDAAEPS